ncbi:MAG: beta-ketoacyl-[acyl-carrier-protein] synthase family protein [Endomicrobium sp.]|jgi:3-oxoacyl-[acyl-carrier-protein] synthase II|nr:beta-ketoacyl-[acyl-carrier-protein] synthase family protein [Endomicrobium sp.]
MAEIVQKSKTRFAVTGMGIVSPLGIGKEMNWRRLCDGQSQVRYEISSKAFVARVSGFDFDEKVRQLGMAFIAANEALTQSGLKDSDYHPQRIGLSCGESKQNMFSKNFNLENTFPQQLKKVLNVSGESRSSAAACATGALNIIQGCRMIEEDVCDAVICGGAETSVHPLYIAAFRNMGALSKQGVRPFDKNRDGFAIGEGAGFIVLEDIKKATLRGAKVYCEIAGFSNGIFSDNLLNIKSCEKMAAIIKNAVKNEVPDYVHMHGTGTKINDLYESEAVASVFNNAQNLSVSSTKAATGHMLGVSGMAGAVFSILAMRDNIVPPTINFKETDIKSGLNYTPCKAQKKEIMSSLSLSFGFGGQGAALYFKRYAGSSF